MTTREGRRRRHRRHKQRTRRGPFRRDDLRTMMEAVMHADETRTEHWRWHFAKYATRWGTRDYVPSVAEVLAAENHILEDMVFNRPQLNESFYFDLAKFLEITK